MRVEIIVAAWIETTDCLVFASQRVARLWHVDVDSRLTANLFETCGVIQAHGESCLVLNDEPLTTTFIPHRDGVAFVRWVAADNEEQLLESAREILTRNVWSGQLRIFVGPDPLLFDNNFGFDAEAPHKPLRVPLAAGAYDVRFGRGPTASAAEVVLLTPAS